MAKAPDQTAIRAVFMRGGTSKAIVFHDKDLPADRARRDEIFLRAIGSPDPNGRQLDGMGGGLSSLSKVCIIAPSTRPDADIDYTFGQVEVGAPRVDYKGRCGSMASAMGPFAVDEGLFTAPDGDVTIRIHDVNVGRIIESTFTVRGGRAAVTGDFAVDGIAGTGAAVRLNFLAPGGAATGSLFPTGSPQDTITVEGLGDIPYSFVDAANPVMFVAAESLGLNGAELPAEIEAVPGLLERIETLRRHVTVHIGAARDIASAGAVSLPRIAFVARPKPSSTLSGKALTTEDADIFVRMIGRGLPHRAVPVTTALCLAVACRLPGTIPHACLGSAHQGDIRIGHPSGVWPAFAEVSADGEVRGAGLVMSARRLFQGEVLVPTI